MHEIPECLSRRYKALDEVIKELTKSAPQQGAPEGCAHSRGTDVGIKLLCNFWNILKEDPDYDLVHAVQQKLGLTEKPREEGHAFSPERIACYMAGKCCRKNDSYDQRRESHHKYKKMCSSNDNNPKCCASRSVSPIGGSEVLPLSKVLCNLKEAASFDKKCNVRINELMETQKVLQDQIQHLEHREKEGVQLLKQADCMWTCMEDTYNKKINESSERQKMLMEQLKELEASTTKWRKNKKDLELQLVSVSKCHEEIKEKINQKNSDFKCMDVEIEDFKKRLESNKKDMEAVKKSFGTKKQASEAKISKIAAEISSLEKVVIEERRLKNNKEQEGSQYVQEARAELQKICKVLLQKKIENEDLRSQKEALNFELDVLKHTHDQCKDKCKNRQQEISDEIAKVEKQIKEFKVKCSRCHECTDTVDIRRCCTDCPRCVEQRDCILEMDHCSPDHTMDCVCTTVKKKFLDNVFDNMYTVLERQVKTGPGKAVADAVLNSLKRSRNGKLDAETRKILQEFILTTVKRNLNLTIVGGAVKTRCEMDPDTYSQLMLCLQQVKVVNPPKEDKATPTKKDSCRRWGGVSECNCPKGPKACICLKKAPPPPQDPSPCPPPTHDKDEEGVVIKCPHRDTAACGADCAMHAVPSRVGADIAAWRPDPCKEQSCRFSNMRAAQCMLGPESLVSLPKGYMTTIPQMLVLQDWDGLMTCKCSHGPTKPCSCQDRTSQPRERIIEEVMGRYGDIPPIDKQMQLQFIFDNLIDSDLVKKRTTKCDESFPKVSTNDSKRLKAGILKSCDNVTCQSLWDEVKEKINRSYSLIENEIGKETYSPKYSVEESKKVPSVLAHVLSGDQRYLSTEVSLPEKSYDSKSVAFIKDTKEEKIKQHFKVIINDADLVGGVTELKTTVSGNLALELDEQVIRLIEDKLTEDQSLFVSLDETDSENYVIIFSPLEKTKNKRRRISIKTTTSGTKYLEIRKEFLNKLKHNELNNNIINKQLETDQVNNTYQAICDCKDHAENVYKDSNIKNVTNQKSYLSKLERLWDDGTKDIFIKVVGQNGLCKEIKGTLTKNSSGDIVVDVTNISFLGEITLKSGDCPAVLTPTNCNSFLLEICHDDNNFNVILRRSTVGGIILVATESSSKLQFIYDSRPKNELFRVKIQNSNKLVEEPPAVLKMTASRNYTFVLDKEYEKTFANTIDECIGDDSECFVELNKTNSGNFLVVLDDNDMLDDCEPNALLTKSPSGHIKMIVQEPAYETVDSIAPKKMSTSSSRAFSLLLDKLPPSNQQIKRDSYKTPLTHEKSCSNSRLNDKVKMKLPDDNVLSETSVALTRTASGQYLVVLNKESKKAFLNQLRNYLIGSHGLIPIKRTETGEITIDLNSNRKSNNCGYGSLKISASGNIYVTVDENIIEELVEDVKCGEGSSLDEVLSKHIIESIKNPVNKSVTTTCNAKPETCSCDVPKCVCKELQFDHDWWSQNSSSYLKSQNRCDGLKNVGKKSTSGDKIYNPQKYKEPCCAGSKSKDSSANKSRHIVIKPCDCSSVVPENPRSEECCYVIEAISTNNIDKYETVPSELMEISAFSNNTLQKRNHAVVYPRIKTKDNAARDRSWDSLNSLPQQLPRFLQDVYFR